jgi:hypothetical protein
MKQSTRKYIPFQSLIDSTKFGWALVALDQRISLQVCPLYDQQVDILLAPINRSLGRGGDSRKHPLLVYSPRNATIGSTFVARRAGRKQASNATAMSSRTGAANVAGSVALTPKSRFLIVRVNATDAIRPSAKPVSTNLIP